MKKREITNLFLHITVGCALAALVAWNPWFMVLATFVYAFLREQAQHRYKISQGENDNLDWAFLKLHKLYYVEKRTFFDFGWLGKQQIFEVLQWTAGAALGVGAWEIREVALAMAVQWRG